MLPASFCTGSTSSSAAARSAGWRCAGRPLCAGAARGVAALAGVWALRLIADAMAQSASDVAKAVSLPDMALGPADASVTIAEYAWMTCPHCAAFDKAVFPKSKSEYIDTGKVRYVFREFPLDIKAAAGAMRALRCAQD